MRACSQCGSVALDLNQKGSVRCTKCGHTGSTKDFPHLHGQAGGIFRSHATTGPGSHRVNPKGNKHS